MSTEKPKTMSPPSTPAPPRPTAVGRPVMTQTLVGHTAPSPPEVTAWLNALLKLDVKPATPLGEALNVAHAAPTVPAFPAVVEDVPELPESALEAVEEPPAPPVAEVAPSAVAVAPELPVAAVEAAVVPPEKELHADIDTASVVGRKRFVALAIVGAFALAAALLVRSQRAPVPTPTALPVAAAPAPVAAPPLAPPPEPSAHLEIGLDPAAAPSEQTTVAPALPATDEKQVQERPRRTRAVLPTGDAQTPVQRGNALLKSGDADGAVAAFEEAVRLAPDAPEGYRGLGLARERQGKSTEAMDAFKRYIKLATRSREREWAARHLYQLAHPDETP